MATLKQKAAFKEVIENHGSISKAMQKVGYKKPTARNPKNLTNSKGWEQLLKRHLPDSILAKKHRELLDKKETVLTQRRDEKGEKIYEVLEQPETNAVSKALDMAYRMKGKYPTEGGGENKTLIVMISGESARRYNIHTDPIPSDSSTRPSQV